MHEIKTFVYFDVEATGLRNSGRPRITELSLVAVNQQDVLELHQNILKLKNESSDKIYSIEQLEKLCPRVVNKLTLCVYPMTTILPGVTSLTGLDNYNLSGQQQFDADTVQMIDTFLTRLPGPVCFVAHNGDRYDYPLLMAEIHRAGASINSDILCVDSYVGIRQIFETREITKKNEVLAAEQHALAELIDAGEFDDDFDENSFMNLSPKRKLDDEDEISNDKKLQKIEEENNVTPARSQSYSDNCNNSLPPVRKKSKDKPQNTVTNYFKSKKRLNFGVSSKIPSFSLVGLHKWLLHYNPSDSHGAEADCMTLLRVTAALGEDWVTWASNNCTMLRLTAPMWGMATNSTK